MMLIATADEILQKGLEMGGFDLQRQQSVKRMTCLKRFRALHSSNPIVYAQIIEDLQTTHTGHLDGCDRVVLVRRLRHSFSVSLRHFTSLSQID
jgi:hypothetical protein